MLPRRRTAGIRTLELNCRPIHRLRTFGVVTANEVSDKLELSAANVSKSNPGPLPLIDPCHHTGHVDS